MRPAGEKGLTLVELIITIAIMGIIATVAIPLLSTSLDAHSKGTARSRLYHEGLMLMERMTTGVKQCTFLLIPNGHKPTRNILAVSDMINDDNDYYFGDPLFPRIDEDLGGRYTQAGYGILLIDDDGDGLIDETSNKNDDDEDGSNDEELLDGLDNDGDGSIDEDLGVDTNNDTFPGIEGIDDDADGQVDEMSGGGDKNDEDEDGLKGEEYLAPIVYLHDPGIDTLWEIATDQDAGTSSPPAVWTALSTHVTDFTAIYDAPNATHGPRIQISLTLTGDDGEVVDFVEYVSPRNTLQKTGKRVR